jgi:hypothetical protein
VSDFRAKLKEINAQLRALISEDGLPLDSLKTTIFDGDKEVMIEGGPNGLIYFASQCLSVASGTSSGAHAHIDECGGADPGSLPLIISLKIEN